VGRPRAHEPAELLDHARDLWAEKGVDGLTIRALGERSGASNGAIYHAFGSRASLLLQVWARTAEAFLDHQEAAAVEALAGAGPHEAVLAAALAPATYAALDPAGARVLLGPAGRRDGGLDETGLSADERGRLRRHRRRVGALVTRLAAEVWPGADDARRREALALVRYCLVDLPGALLLAPERLDDPVPRRALTHAVRGILQAGPA
jgi:AcrR family transcriptional regulator